MLALQKVGAGAQARGVGGLPDARRIPLEQRMLPPREIDGIAVGLFFGGAAGVERFARARALQDADVGREKGVEGVRDAPGLDREGVGQGEIAHLPRRVYARVRAAAARHARRDAEGAQEGALQLALHGAAVLLDLPAAQGGAVIGYEENCVHAAPPIRGCARGSRTARPDRR